MSPIDDDPDRMSQRLLGQEGESSILEELEGERRITRQLEQRLAALERENAAVRFEAQMEANHRLRVEGESVDLRERLAVLQREVDEIRFEASWKAQAAAAEERKLRRDLAFLAGSLRQSAASGWAAGAAARVEPHIEERAMEIVRGLFDEAFYRTSHPDVEPGPDGALEHFLRLGGFFGRDPHPLFDSSFYLERHADVLAAGVNPLVHFVLLGAKEGRAPHPLFDVSHYLSQLTRDDLERPCFNPLLHFIRDGAWHGLDPHPLFRTAFYLEQVPELRGGEVDPLSHYTTEGAWQGYDPHPLFDSSYSLARYPQPRLVTMDPLSRFVLHGGAADEDPHAFFCSARYRQQAGGLSQPVGNPLLHFDGAGSRSGLAPRQVFNLTLDQGIVGEYDRLRKDGLPVLLLVSHMGGGGTEKHVRELAGVLRAQCHVFLLRPANHHLLGPATAGLVALSPLERELPGLLFNPVERLDDLVAVLRGIGIARIHIHQLEGNQGYLENLVIALGLPFDFSVHDYFVLSPRVNVGDHPRSFLGDDSDDMSPLPDGAATGALAEWRRRHGWLVTDADRVLVPSADAARRLARVLPPARLLAVAHPELPTFDPLQVAPPRIRSGEPLKVLILGEISPHKGEAVVREVCRQLYKRRELIELHLIGFLASGIPIDGLQDHGRYRDASLARLIERLSPHVAWFPAQWPETYSYTLSAALRARLPVVVSDLGALPERVGGRPWSWVLPWASTPDAWCDALIAVRSCLLDRRAPTPPVVLDTAAGGFYPDDYLRGLHAE